MTMDARTKITGRDVLQLRTVLRSIDFHASGLHQMVEEGVNPINMAYLANVIATIEDLATVGLAAIEHAECCRESEYTLNARAH